MFFPTLYTFLGGQVIGCDQLNCIFTILLSIFSGIAKLREGGEERSGPVRHAVAGGGHQRHRAADAAEQRRAAVHDGS